MFNRLIAGMGKTIDTISEFESRISAAGFTNVHEKVYKVPVGDWVKDPVLKEAGKFHKMIVEGGMKGYAVFLLTTVSSIDLKYDSTTNFLVVWRADALDCRRGPNLPCKGQKRNERSRASYVLLEEKSLGSEAL